jgi:hypothetical protein
MGVEQVVLGICRNIFYYTMLNAFQESPIHLVAVL